MNVIFMGTPDFAVPGLKKIIESRHKVLAVVTVADKPAGRGKKIRSSAVKQFALEQGLPVLQPEKLKAPEFLEELNAFNADLFVVVAFRILPPDVFNMPQKGTINVHASLLPAYRGAAPIQWAIINGEDHTGVTTFFIDEKVDTGQILLKKETDITSQMTAGELHDKLALLGAQALIETIDGIDSGLLKPQPQSGQVTSAPKITKELGRIDWSRQALDIHNLVRGLSPYPGSYTFIKGKLLKVLGSQVKETVDKEYGNPGIIVSINKNGPLEVQTGRGVLCVTEVQPEGKRAMGAGEFIRGSRLQVGDKLE